MDGKTMPTPPGKALVRVLVVDDDPAVRELVRDIVEANANFHVVAEAGNGNEAVEKFRLYTPDVVLMDLEMPYRGGLDATRQISGSPAPAKVVIMTSHGEDDNVRRALQLGASAFMTKASIPDQLERVVSWVLEGKTVLDPEVTAGIVPHLQSPTRAEPRVTSEERARLNSLTERETDVLCLIAQGMSNRDIGDSLTMTEATVKSHVSRIMQKLGAANRVQAAIAALKAGIGPSGT
ncbi:response regulator [Streptomyces sp. NPDC127110]|uniref:response regulator n=1 Tax=Streptomyces sp. NPDC127110 TaxID=3345362 RepID=UPI00363E6961